MRAKSRLQNVCVEEDLGEAVLGVLGLWEMGYADEAIIGHLLHINVKGTRALCRKLRHSRNRAVRGCISHGLPAGLYARLPLDKWAVCPKCGKETKFVPCPVCKLQICSGWRLEDDDCGEAPLPARPTPAWPGSEAKIMVMRIRLARGEQLCHPEDGFTPTEGKDEPKQRDRTDASVSRGRVVV